MFSQIENSYARLPEILFAPALPTPVAAPKLIDFNQGLAKELCFDIGHESKTLANLFSGNVLAAGMKPIAMAYSGHQFGSFTHQLGDGRAILLGEAIDSSSKRRDIHLKGAGKTAFSRNGDGRAALGPVIREYVISEAMHTLGVKTTRSLAAVATGEEVYRETILPGAVLTRIAQSHIRIGTFEFAAAQGGREIVRALADYTIERLYPHITKSPASDRYSAFLDAVMDAQAALIASWMHIGFIHGVMNTDNIAVSGETIDYGPCAFMDEYDQATVFSSIDLYGRYAFGNQPKIAQWNLARLAETMLHLFHPDVNEAIAIAENQIARFPGMYERYWLEGMCRKIGIMQHTAGDVELIVDLLQLMHRHKADYTLSFRSLGLLLEGSNLRPYTPYFPEEAFSGWIATWKKRLERGQLPLSTLAANMQETNPLFIPRNGHIEAVIQAAVENSDFSKMKRLQSVLASPFEEQSDAEIYALPVRMDRSYRTFCGT